jgi:hypothetical protein
MFAVGLYTYFKRPYLSPIYSTNKVSMSVQALLSFDQYGSLVPRTAARLTAAKFKPLVCSLLVFALSSVANMNILMILHDLRLYNFVRKSVYMQISRRSEDLVSQVLRYQNLSVCRQFPGGARTSRHTANECCTYS